MHCKSSESRSSLPLEHSPAEACLAGEQRARSRYRLNEELIAFDSKVAPLFGAVPGLIPGDIDRGNEVATFDTVSATVCEERSVECKLFGVRRSSLAVLAGTDRNHAPLARQNDIAFWPRS